MRASKLFLLAILTLLLIPVAAQTEEEGSTSAFSADLGTDLVSSYVWRGLAFDNAPNIQGSGEIGLGGFFAGAWASVNFPGTYQETDLYAGYGIGNFTLSVTDYFTGWEDYFNFVHDQTGHVGELIASYTLSENIPLTFTLGTLVYGADKKLDSDTSFSSRNNYSTYLEMMYPFTVGETELSLVAGGVLQESAFYISDGAALINLGIAVSKEIKVTELFSLPISFALTVNPELENVYTVFKISF